VTFKEVLAHVIDWLQQDQRLSYRALKRQFALDDDYLEDLKVELIEVRQVALDQGGKILVWRGTAAAAVPTAPPQPVPLTYYTALAMQAAVKQYAAEVQRSHGVPVQIRVGLNTGAVVVRAIGNDLHMDYTAVGQTTHLAARMEQMALPSSILLTQATLSLAEGYVQVTPLGPMPVKGVAAPIDVFELVGASGIRRRLQATAARGQALARAEAGHGQVVALVGEAGVGKSRLVYEFVHAHHLQGWRVLESASVSYGKATPYFPIIDLLKRYSHVDDSDDPHY
jgi:Adenylate and Guanylate cyclase catalytic domain/AAA ATPase domain